MSEIPNIINTPILSSEYDSFWQDNNGVLEGLEPRPALFITHPIEHDSQRVTVDNMIRACQLQPQDYNVLELPAEAKIAWHLIRDKLCVHSVVLLGIDVEVLGLSVLLMPHQTSRFDNCAFIPTLCLAQLDMYPDIKKHFWRYGLKPVFLDKVYG